MKQILIVTIFFLSQPLLAHLHLGEYKGVTESGEACSIFLSHISVKNEIYHPINQILHVEFEQEEFELSVSPAIDPHSNKINYDPNVLNGFKGIRNNGSKAISLKLKSGKMERHHDPSEFMFLRNDANGMIRGNKITCTNLKYQH